MKGFAPPPRFGGAQIPHEPLPITRTITVTEGISVKDLAITQRVVAELCQRLEAWLSGDADEG